ncbi:MAG: bifunctional acetate--CoA ligase family protein/GNAT family N-acetyltransferase [Deltaproteobacteria bacterium]|nr:bifunctional acetate--CoA ligase family protein/GNAT family N-acetyltransferase [Deltaproteobacteria bacterium]
MSVYNLDKVFHPAAVAVVGASDQEGSVGKAVIRSLERGGYQGPIFPINIRHKKIAGRPVHRSLTRVGRPIDLAVVATPLKTAPEIIRDCAKAEVGAVVILSAGGKETGQAGRELEEEIQAEAKRGGIRIIGPNCLGAIATKANLNVTLVNQTPLPGHLAFISQSGAIGAAILDLAASRRIGFSHFVSIGSMLDVDFGDLIDYLGNEPEVRSILLYIENLTNFRKFMSAARAVSRVKPIVALKAGRSPSGARAAASHTGALAGEDAVYDAAFERAGMVRVETIEDLFDCAELMASQPRPKGPRLAVITNAGGPGVMAADALAHYGLEPAALSAETKTKVDELLPAFWSRGNPIDILGDAPPERYCKVVEICLSAPEIDGVLAILTPQAMTKPTEAAVAVAGTLKDQSYPAFTVWMGGQAVEEGRAIFHQAGIPTYDTPERAVQAFKYMHAYGRNLKLLQEAPARFTCALTYDQAAARAVIDPAVKGVEAGASLILTEFQSKAILSAYGIPTPPIRLAASVEEAVLAAGRMGYPVALKIHSPDITHKSDAHGVELNLAGDDDLRQAFDRIMAGARAYDPQARILGVAVQPMIERPDYELIIGSKRDADFGPVILFGLGGVLTEVLQDRAIALPPLNRLLARRLMERTRVFRLLKGFRHYPPANLALLEEMLVRLSHLVTDFPEKLDINPLIAANDNALALDARMVVQPADVPSSLHLVISPYPNQYETTAVTKGGLDIRIRPIRPEDAPLHKELFETLSPQSVYFRFLSPLKALSPDILARYTQVDYDREIALVAVQAREQSERLLGVGRVIIGLDEASGEFAIAVGDPWQSQGVGAELLKRCIAIARERGLKSLWGLVLADNHRMIQMARYNGFTVKRVAHSAECEINLDLTGPGFLGERAEKPVA